MAKLENITELNTTYWNSLSDRCAKFSELGNVFSLGDSRITYLHVVLKKSLDKE